MKKPVKIGLTLAIVILAILFYPRIISVLNVETLRGLIEPFGVFAPLAFGVLYIVAGIFFIPLSVFSIAGGVLFGTLWGLLVVLLSATISAAAAFFIARQFSSKVPQAQKGIIQKLQKTVEKRLEKSTFQTIVILRLLYMPYIALSYAAGLVKTCKFWPYIVATFFTNIVGSFVFVYLGDQLDKGLTALIIPVVLILLTLLIPKIVKKFVKK